GSAVTDETAALRTQVARQIAHWQAAAVGLQDLRNFASVEAWRSLESYLDVAVRTHLEQATTQLRRQSNALAAELAGASTLDELDQLRLRVIRFRSRYLQVETALEFFGHAINSRTSPRLAGLLDACDVLARLSIERVLVPLRKEIPPVLT